MDDLFGLVFWADGHICLTEYLGNDEFTDGVAISNHKPYENLGEDQLSFVKIVKEERPDGSSAYILTDLRYFTVGNNLREDCKSYEILADMDIRDKVSEFMEELIVEHKGE